MLDWLAGLLRARPDLTPDQAQRLAAWSTLPARSRKSRLGASRFVIVDVESSGLNLARDRLIAIGAIAVTNGRVDLADSFEVVLQQAESSSHENILIHGIGADEQRNGVPPVEALLRFLEFLGNSPLVAFHVTFDETMIRRALKQYLGLNFRHDWLDLAYVVPGLNPGLSKEFRLLDEWLTHFGITNPNRHNAVADASSTAQLFVRASKQAARQRLHRFQDLRHLEKAQRWISWQQT